MYPCCLARDARSLSGWRTVRWAVVWGQTTMPVTRRQRRINELLREEISTLLLREARDPRLAHVTVTDVEISSDLGHARVYISVIGDQHAKVEALAGLEHATSFLKRGLAARVSLRRVPDLSFHLDDSIERGQRILELLDQLGEEAVEAADPGEEEEHA